MTALLSEVTRRWWANVRHRLRPGLLVAGLVLGVSGVVVRPASPALASC